MTSKMTNKLILGMTGILFSGIVMAESQTIAACQAISEPTNRLACFDSLPCVDSLIGSKHGIVSEDPIDKRATPDARALFGKKPTEAKRIIEKKLDLEHIDQITSAIINVKRTAYKKLQLTLENDQVWRQLDREPIFLRAGDDVLIRSAKLGSYLLSKQSGSGSIRVKRIK